MDNESNPPYNPNYVNPQQHYHAVEEYDIVSSESPNTRQSNNCKTQPTNNAAVGGAAVAGTVAGLAVSGPVIGVAAGGAAAYAASRNSGAAGNAARQTGEVVASAGSKAKEANDKHEITKKSINMAKSAFLKVKELDEKHQILNNTKKAANSAVSTAKGVDEKHHVSSNTKKAASNVMAKAKDVNEKHHVTEKTKEAASIATKKLALGVKFMSKSMASTKKPENSAVPAN